LIGVAKLLHGKWHRGKIETRRYNGKRHYKSAALAPTAERQNFKTTRHNRQTEGCLPLAAAQLNLVVQHQQQ
jgi:hypothetical protein